jgi:meiotic recombination protein REC8
MLMLLRTVQNYALDPDAGKARYDISAHPTRCIYQLMNNRPEQLVLQDDPSFLPNFALPPPELLLADLDPEHNFDITRSGDSQSLTPFGSQHSRSSSHAGTLGGLVLPTSSPDPLGGFQLQGDNDITEPGGFFGADNGLDLGEPDFTFDENGEFVEALAVQNAVETPAARSGAAMHSDAGASAKVRKEHEDGRMGGTQVSLTAFCCIILTLFSLVCPLIWIT